MDPPHGDAADAWHVGQIDVVVHFMNRPKSLKPLPDLGELSTVVGPTEPLDLVAANLLWCLAYHCELIPDRACALPGTQWCAAASRAHSPPEPAAQVVCSFPL